MTGEIITNGANAFSPIVEKLGNITTEFVPYLVYIAIAVLGISLTINIVKYILNYLKINSYNSINWEELRRYQRYRHDKDDYYWKLKNDNYYSNLKYDWNDKWYKKRKKYFNYK